MWVLDGDCANPIQDDEPFFGLDGVQYPPQWDKSTVPGMQEVVLTPEPVTPGHRTIGNAIEMIDGIPTRVWATEPVPNPPTQEELAAMEAAHRARQIMLLEAELSALKAGL
jgi:hypothetical protein